MAAVPYKITRRSSQEMTPLVEKSKVNLGLAQKPYRHRYEQTQDNSACHTRLRDHESFGDFHTTPLSMMTTDDLKTCVEGVIASDTNAQEQDYEQLHPRITKGVSKHVSHTTTPSRSVLLARKGESIQKIGQWYFACQLPETNLQYFGPVQREWVDKIWEMGRKSAAMFAVLGAFAFHKKATLAGSQAGSNYYTQKDQIIRHIAEDMQRSHGGPDPLTVVAMAMLAYLDIGEDRLDDAGTHLRAVCKFVDMPRMPPQGWLYCAWIDFRHALVTSTEPCLPFYIPEALREVAVISHRHERKASRLGPINASHSPRSPVFTLEIASEIFTKLHDLCCRSDALLATEAPPFGQVYALEYGLRMVQAHAEHNDKDFFTSPTMLITFVMQLHVWMAARFYTPQARETHAALLVKACKIIDRFDDMTTQWYTYAGLESLLWILFTLSVSLRAHELPQTTKVLELLYRTLRMAHIDCCGDLQTRLEQWPWLANWHPFQIHTVWEMLCARYPDIVPQTTIHGLEVTAQDPHKAQHRWSLSGLEFYSSL
jgi:hypothetical protein